MSNENQQQLGDLTRDLEGLTPEHPDAPLARRLVRALKNPRLAPLKRRYALHDALRLIERLAHERIFDVRPND